MQPAVSTPPPPPTQLPSPALPLELGCDCRAAPVLPLPILREAGTASEVAGLPLPEASCIGAQLLPSAKAVSSG